MQLNWIEIYFNFFLCSSCMCMFCVYFFEQNSLFWFSSSCVLSNLVLVSHKNSLRLDLSFDNKTDGGHICVAKLCKVVVSYFVLDAMDACECKCVRVCVARMVYVEWWSRPSDCQIIWIFCMRVNCQLKQFISMEIHQFGKFL